MITHPHTTKKKSSAPDRSTVTGVKNWSLNLNRFNKLCPWRSIVSCISFFMWVGYITWENAKKALTLSMKVTTPRQIVATQTGLCYCCANRRFSHVCPFHGSFNKVARYTYIHKLCALREDPPDSSALYKFRLNTPIYGCEKKIVSLV